MTVALSHIVLLRDLLRPQLNDTSSFANIPSPSTPWQVAPTISTLAGALYKVFRASPDHPARNEMCQACFDYMSLEGVFSNGLIALLSGLDPRPLSSVLHFFAVAIYGVGRLKLPFKSSLHCAFPLM
ncbi:hypothetical protein POPTR_015G121201v4 [Populus trichocarpa]|nr:hypothetical protein BDE02_15G103800 [Populus trichocarpa]KAI9381521.1 hypothetical protein POPTR_015G121201v4 [Populus trichocarpa]